MTKKEIKVELNELGVEYDSTAKKEELEKLLAKKQKEEEKKEAEPAEEDKPKETPRAEIARERNAVRIFNAGGQFVREYSEAVHGADWKKLADEFTEAPKNKGKYAQR